MDWAKTKIVLIWIFVILNVFLTVNLLAYFENGETVRENTSNALKIMESRGYVLSGKIPYSSSSYSLSYENAVLDREAVASVLLGKGFALPAKIQDDELLYDDKILKFINSGEFEYTDKSPDDYIDIQNIDKAEKYCRNFLSNLLLPVTDYALDTYKINSDKTVTFTFYEKYKSFFIFSNRAEITLSAKGVTRLECRVIGKKSLENTRSSISIVPAYQILLRHFSKGSNTVIQDIEIGFLCTYLNGESSYSSIPPVWRIIVQGEGPRYFSAFDGHEIESV
ncbi:regulatory protein YycI of two-component signal transduction system YycFG [Anaerobacterium chartisolvens]|uniref:Regulatory protein YycI of two-component signal transduction system YycFG n=1 Tax=Anaerobacterium chartisolvens TaxID=1297424 RepID=A0A369AL84_9FIRM|nr:two-component system regulatory protein YycI [Anaerobacterium chartisolvens]RCX09088.1 regulatory protein YycI of two-component signal transduction system YycFG [Anaerobacterium chartisolvens]